MHHQGIICGVAVGRSSLRRIGSYASVVAPWRLASGALLVIRDGQNPHPMSSLTFGQDLGQVFAIDAGVHIP